MTNNNQIHKLGMDQPNSPISVTGGGIIFDGEEMESLRVQSHAAALKENVRGHCWFYSYTTE